MTGKYTIYVSATGNFDSGNPTTDADALAKAFVEQLQANGSTVADTKFCFVGTETCKDILTGQPKA